MTIQNKLASKYHYLVVISVKGREAEVSQVDMSPDHLPKLSVETPGCSDTVFKYDQSTQAHFIIDVIFLGFFTYKPYSIQSIIKIQIAFTVQKQNSYGKNVLAPS